MRELRTIRWAVDDDGIATLALNRPEARNAIHREMAEEMHTALAELGRDRRVRALILRGEGGKAFAGLPTDGATDAGDAADQGHVLIMLMWPCAPARATVRLEGPHGTGHRGIHGRKSTLTPSR